MIDNTSKISNFTTAKSEVIEILIDYIRYIDVSDYMYFLKHAV